MAPDLCEAFLHLHCSCQQTLQLYSIFHVMCVLVSDVTVGAFMADSVVLLRWACLLLSFLTHQACFFFFAVFNVESFSTVCSRTRPVVTVDVSIFLPVSINITVPQCHEGLPNTNCFNVSVCMRFRGRQLPGLIGEATSSEQSTSIFCDCDLSMQANSGALGLRKLFKSTPLSCNNPLFLLRITVVLMPCDR